MNKIFKIFCAIAAVSGAAALYYMPLVINEADKKYCDDCNYLMILGGNIIGADTPCPQLKERMKAAAEYLNKNSDCFAVPCGGCFREGQKKSEAEIIADYLVRQGIDESRIIPEDKSTTTFENFEFARIIIEEHSGKPADEAGVAFLSSDYHVFRASKIAECCGFNKIGKVSCLTSDRKTKAYLREYVVSFELFAKYIKYKLTR